MIGNVSICAEMVTDDITGLVSRFLTNTDFETLAQRIKEIITDPARWQLLALASRKHYDETLNWIHHASQLHKTIENARYFAAKTEAATSVVSHL